MEIDTMHRIKTNGVTLDPSTPVGEGLGSGSAATSNYILVQTSDPVSDDQSKQLVGLGAAIHEYVSEDTYLCGFATDDLTAVRALPFVKWAGVYHEGFKIRPTLRPDAMMEQAATIGQPSLGLLTQRTPHKVDILLHSDVDPSNSQLKERIAAAVHVSPEDLQTGHHKVRVQVQERFLNDLAAIDEVRSIEPVPERKLFNSVARTILNAHVVVNATDYQGDGEIVVVNDTGFDDGSTTAVHPAFTGRVLKLVALGRPGRTDDPDGHGTHVSGSVLGNGNSPSMGGAIQGTAPEAKLILQSLLDASGGLGGIPADLHDLFTPPYQNDKARIQTNSWGSTTPGLPYDQSAREIDDFVWNHPDCVICFAAGNDGTDANHDGVDDLGSVGSEAAAKNCITVGASESNRPNIELTYGSLRPSSWPANPIFRDKTADNPNGMAAFSSRGPTKEQRFKPDVVAPGTSILSTRSRKAVSVPTVFGSSSDPLFFFDDGTSMATPLTAGCVAVIRETLVKNGVPTPSAALIKAILINGADSLPGQYSPTECGPSPNNASGWGRVNLAGSIIIPGPNPDAGFGDEGPLKQGQQSTIVIKVPPRRDRDVGPAGVGPTLKVTLVWSDPAGPMLQNDLDLIVTAANGDERHGNAGTTKDFDRTNNVEQVLWTNIPPGNVEITVRAFHITQFAQPWAYAWHIG